MVKGDGLLDKKSTTDEITLPVSLWEKLNDIVERLSSVSTQLESCSVDIAATREYQKVQNSNVANVIVEMSHIRDVANSTASATASAAAAAASAASAAATAASEISQLKITAATKVGQEKGISLTGQRIIVGIGALLAIANLGLIVWHIMGH